ncbi:baseplate J/gp47 family protein [Clostridium sp.]
MKIPDMGRDSSRELIEKIKERASSYTPEWRMDLEHPDGGTALALLFSGMYEDTLKKYDQLPKKHMLDFFQCAGTSLAPVRPASGYAVFGLVNQEADGTGIRRGTDLLARTEGDEGEEIVFETRNDVYVTPSRIRDMIQVIPEKDGIYPLEMKEGQNTPGNLPLFEAVGENKQEHLLYLAHSYAVFLKEAGVIRLVLRRTRNQKEEMELLEALADPACAVVEYSAGEGFEPFASVRLARDEGELLLYKEAGQPKMERCAIQETETYWIRIRCKDISRLSGLEAADIRVISSCNRNIPDVIFAGGVEQRGEYLPFGEQMGLYEEVYFASEQALSQKHAQITLSFQMSFLRIPSETYGQERKRDWKLIMKQADFMPDPEYDIGVDEVIWEYYNGNDWRKLPESDKYAGIFRAASDQLEKRTEIVFQCPDDLMPILVQSAEGLYIRARILKMKNLYRWNGQYITPVLRDTGFEYQYHAPLPVPELLVVQNHMQSERIRPADYFQDGKSLKPFRALPESTETLYIGFDIPFEQEPVRILFQMEAGKRTGKLLRYEYFSRNAWQPLNLIDGTGGFEKTGIVTVLGNAGFTSTLLWGKQRFWIRIRKLKTEQESAEEGRAVIKSIWMNATEISAEETMAEELFSIEANEKNAVFYLTRGNITSANVWVREHAEYTDEQIAVLREKKEIRTEKTDDGTSRFVWICWEEQENFASSDADDCHYMLDRNEGILRFSDGVHGRIPDPCEGSSIRVEYRCGGGQKGNVPAGAVNRFRETTGFVNQVTNPMPLFGGADRENVEQAILRQGRAFRHRGRAVTAGDYEALALESSGSILQAKCFPGQGVIHLVLLIRDHAKDRENFYQVRRECLQYMKDKLPVSLLESGKLQIVEPEFVVLSVKAQVRVADMNQILETRQRILTKLHCFLDLMEGNFQGNGWKIGELPKPIQILNELRRIQGVGMVTELRLLLQIERNGKWTDLDPDEAESLPFAVAVEGNHQIDIITGGVSE